MRKQWIIFFAVILFSCKKENKTITNNNNTRTDAFTMIIHDTSYAGYAPYLGDYKAIFYPNQQHSFWDSVRASIISPYYSYDSVFIFSYGEFDSTRNISLDNNYYEFAHLNTDNRIDRLFSDYGATNLNYTYFPDGSISGFSYDGPLSHDSYTMAITSRYGDTSIAHWHYDGDGSVYERDDTMIYYPEINNTDLLTLSGVQWGGQDRFPVAYTTPFPNLHMKLIKEIKYILRCEYTFDSRGRVTTATVYYSPGYIGGKTVLYTFIYPQ